MQSHLILDREMSRLWAAEAKRVQGSQEAVTKDEKIMGGVPIPRSAFLRFTDEMHCQLYFPYPGDQVAPSAQIHNIIQSVVHIIFGLICWLN